MNVQTAPFDVLPSLRVIRKKDEGGGGAGRHLVGSWLVYIYINTNNFYHKHPIMEIYKLISLNKYKITE